VTRGDQPKQSTVANRRCPRSGVPTATDFPLFCFCIPLGGDLRCYDTLAPVRSGIVWCMDLRAPGCRPGPRRTKRWTTSFGGLHLTAIRSVCPDGPYCLAGWSTAEISLNEIARRLHLDSLPVASLIMNRFAVPIGRERRPNSDDARVSSSDLIDLRTTLRYVMKIEYDICIDLSDDKAMEHVLALSIEHGKCYPAGKQTPTEITLRRTRHCLQQHVPIFCRVTKSSRRICRRHAAS